MSRIPYDNKSHKVDRRRAIRAKESVRMMVFQPDQADCQPRKVTRRMRRNGVSFNG